jgi:hypothetical protein
MTGNNTLPIINKENNEIRVLVQSTKLDFVLDIASDNKRELDTHSNQKTYLKGTMGADGKASFKSFVIEDGTGKEKEISLKETLTFDVKDNAIVADKEGRKKLAPVVAAGVFAGTDPSKMPSLSALMDMLDAPKMSSLRAREDGRVEADIASVRMFAEEKTALSDDQLAPREVDFKVTMVGTRQKNGTIIFDQTLFTDKNGVRTESAPHLDSLKKKPLTLRNVSGTVDVRTGLSALESAPALGSGMAPTEAEKSTSPSDASDSGKDDEGALKKNGKGITGLLIGSLLGGMMGGGIGALIGALLIGLLGSSMDGEGGLFGSMFGGGKQEPKDKIQVVEKGKAKFKEAAFALDANGKMTALPDDMARSDDNLTQKALENAKAVVKGKVNDDNTIFEITHIAVKGKDGFKVGEDGSLSMYDITNMSSIKSDGTKEPINRKLEIKEGGAGEKIIDLNDKKALGVLNSTAAITAALNPAHLPDGMSAAGPANVKIGKSQGVSRG